MNEETLNKLLTIPKRNGLFKEIVNEFRGVNNIEKLKHREFNTKDGIVPVITLGNEVKSNDVKVIKIFIAAQHNEYNGLFGILEFFKELIKGELKVEDYLKNDQILFFFPLMNPYGFLNPNNENKSGYFLKNGKNLNRFWRRTFAPEYKNNEVDLDNINMPEQTYIVKSILEKYWVKKRIKLYFMDFHETSLLERYMLKLSRNLNSESYTYKFTHWIEERIIYNIIKLYNIQYSSTPLFKKCSTSINHSHLNLSAKQIELVYEKLLEYIVLNIRKLPFYFCHSNNTDEYCVNLAQKVYNKLKDKLWETRFLTFDHNFQDHGCFIKMSDATTRNHVYAMELESQKQFFNIFKEIEKTKTQSNYFEEKLNDINISIELVKSTIIEMIHLV
ncbi:MAG: hypothetical protein ACFE85_09840 [Candidatus Hodarchaeota archaeon]